MLRVYVSITPIQLSSVQSLSRVWLFATPWIAAYQASLSITNSWSSPKLMSIESVMPSSHLILCHPLLPLPSIPPSIRVFYNESTLHMRWPKYWSFSFSISPSKEHPVMSDSLWRHGLYSPWNSPDHARILEWVAFPFSTASSLPGDWTQVSCIAGRFFTYWAITPGLVEGKKS